MFYFISGPLALLKPTFAVVNAGGVGFKLIISSNTYDSLLPLAAEGKEVRLFTHLAVHEDDMELFGFFTEAELDTFKLLLTVSGVGPKAAIAILSCFTPEKLALAICTDDKKAISRANGIGPKTAARIILELHDKLSAEGFGTDLSSPAATAGSAAVATAAGGKMNEAQEALLVLGYSRSEILTALHSIDTTNLDLESIIRAALKKMMK